MVGGQRCYLSGPCRAKRIVLSHSKRAGLGLLNKICPKGSWHSTEIATNPHASGCCPVGIGLRPGLVWGSEIVQSWTFWALSRFSCARAVAEPPRAGAAFALAGEAEIGLS